MKQNRAGSNTRQKILEAGLSAWPEITVSNLARACNTSHAAILYHFKSHELKDTVAKYAVEQKNVDVIRQLIAARHKAVQHMTPAVRAAYFFNS